MPIGAEMFDACYPWDKARDASIRTARVVDPLRDTDAYPLESENQSLLIEMGTVMGHEGSDYQNPYVWQGRGVFSYPDPRSPNLVPAFGVGQAQSPDDVRRNIQATSGLLETG